MKKYQTFTRGGRVSGRHSCWQIHLIFLNLQAYDQHVVDVYVSDKVIMDYSPADHEIRVRE